MSHSIRSLQRESGFSLIEILAAIGVMGVLTAFAAGHFMAFQPVFQVRGAALEVAGDMSIARLSAVKEGRIYQLLPVAGGYKIQRDNGAGGWDLIKQMTLANSWPSITFGYTGITKDPYGVNITAAVPAGAITFHSNGTIVGAAGVFLQTTATPLTQQAVSMTAAGRIRVWKYTGSTWS